MKHKITDHNNINEHEEMNPALAEVARNTNIVMGNKSPHPNPLPQGILSDFVIHLIPEGEGKIFNILL
jgi:hypothetical protein